MGQESDDVPPLDFTTFVLSLSSQALLHLGVQLPGLGEKAEAHLGLARHTIDLLGLLEQKTRGNLTGEEERVLQQVLTDLRLRYLEAAKSRA